MIGLAFLAAWAAYQMAPERVSIMNRKIVKRHKLITEHLLLSELHAIRFHYHAAAGFVAVWELAYSSGNSITVNSGAKGMKQLALDLVRNIPGFSADDLDKTMRAGDIEDVICLWKSA